MSFLSDCVRVLGRLFGCLTLCFFLAGVWWVGVFTLLPLLRYMAFGTSGDDTRVALFVVV